MTSTPFQLPLKVERNVGPPFSWSAVLFCIAALIQMEGMLRGLSFFQSLARPYTGVALALGGFLLAAAVTKRERAQLLIDDQGIMVSSRYGTNSYAWPDVVGARTTKNGVTIDAKNCSKCRNEYNLISKNFNLDDRRLLATVAKWAGDGENVRRSTLTTSPAGAMAETRLRRDFHQLSLLLVGTAAILLGWTLVNSFEEYKVNSALDSRGQTSIGTTDRIMLTSCGRWSSCDYRLSYTYVAAGKVRAASDTWMVRRGEAAHAPRVGATVKVIYDGANPSVSRLYDGRRVTAAQAFLIKVGLFGGVISLLLLSFIAVYYLMVRLAIGQLQK